MVTWGDCDSGGDSGEVQDELRGVEQICSTEQAFAALTGDGQVVAWGDARRGGSAAQGELKDQVVERIYSSASTFVALLGSGRVVKWGGSVSKFPEA